jgi:cholesterol transport system auxiliary component
MIERRRCEVPNTIHRASAAASFRHYSLPFALLTLLAFLGGCAKAKPVHYYQITYPSSALASANSVEVSILVRTFFASHLYREDRIVYGSTSEQMGTYQEERWAEAPTDMLQYALVRGLRASGHFRSVLLMRSDADGDYIISGHLYEFKEMDNNGVQARLNYDLEMRDLKSRKLVWTYAYNHDEPATGKGVPALAAAMDKNVQQSVQAVQAALGNYFKSQPPK